MDSGDYLHDSDDYYYNDEDENIMHDSDGFDADSDGFDADAIEEHVETAPDFTVLSIVDIQRRQDEDISQVSSVLSVSRSSAIALLIRYKWDAVELKSEWFADENNVRQAVGLLVGSPIIKSPVSRNLSCGICFDEYEADLMPSAACGHRYCLDCWKSYVGSAIADGPGCLSLRCPEPSCAAAVGIDMINNVASDGDKAKYSAYLIRSYVEVSRNIKWCPSPGCEFAIDFIIGSESRDVRCQCLHSFCWGCGEDAHRPVDCATVAKWMLKNSSEAENTQYILAYTKPCPKCNRAIEKNHGCNHMTCRPPCGFQFCWLCLKPLDKHGYSGGGCNSYRELAKGEAEREHAKLSLERYTHYYERWASNDKSLRKALQDLKGLDLQNLRAKLSLTASGVDFVRQAWLQIVECRRTLKWTYAYGYYTMENEAEAKKAYFEHVQGDAEFALERLHHCAENELRVYLDAVAGAEEMDGFGQFKTKLAGLTGVARNYFDNLVRALENGLQDIGAGGRKRCRGVDAGSSSGGEGISWDSWTCKLCTFRNPTAATVCQMCELWTCDRCTYSNPSTAKVCVICSETEAGEDDQNPEEH